MNAKTVELHLLQSFPPSCVNRDGNNSPKDCTFGDVRRARISSQCLKRATRQADSFAETVGEEVGIRSREMRAKKIIPYFQQQGMSPEAAGKAADDFWAALSPQKKGKNAKTKNPKDGTVEPGESQDSAGMDSTILYFGDSELHARLDAFSKDDPHWKDAPMSKAPDIALFGRMLAVAPILNVDAAAQVAHAFSTHRLSQDMDYWTAADDLKSNSQGDDAGASMLGTAEFNASTFYRYACVSLPILQSNLGGDEAMARKTVEGFLLASYDAIPTGKLNGHAHFNPPLFALAVVRSKGMPLNLANAFLHPVRAKDGKCMCCASAEALMTHLSRMRQMAPIDSAAYGCTHALGCEVALSGVERIEGYRQLVAWVLEAL